MARALVACSKNQKFLDSILSKIGKLNLRLTPDHVEAREPLVIRNSQILTVVFNPPPDLDRKEGSICLGKMMPPMEGWWLPGSPIPDGTFALFRQDEDALEIASDSAGTRSIWYYQDNQVFLASNSQRAILAVLGRFFLNATAIPWMVSSGCTGPGLAWDERIKMLPPDSRLSLDIHSWNSSLKAGVPEFSVKRSSLPEQKALLRQAIEQTFSSLDLDWNKWLLPLSGGYDSRAILLHITARSGLKCVTWGLKNALQENRNDAYIARQLAKEWGVKFHYFAIEPGDEPLERIFERFIAAGEGRIDHVSGYMDGFKIWQHLYRQNTSGVIRGDEGFGWIKVITEGDVRRNTGLVTMQDHRNLKASTTYGMREQSIPANLRRVDNETLSTWRDRIYHGFRIPVILSALNEIKSAYVEVVNPLLSRRIVEQVRTLPDSLRTDKALFKRIVAEISPPVDFAEKPAIAPAVNYLTSSTAARLLKGEVEEMRERNIIPDEFLVWLLGGIKSDDRVNQTARGKGIKDWIPAKVKPYLKSLYGKQNIPLNSLAFRVYIISRLHKIIDEDIRTVQTQSSGVYPE